MSFNLLHKMNRKVWNTLCHIYRVRRFSISCVFNQNESMNIFDRHTKTLQKERAAKLPDIEVYDYLKEEIGYRLSDRIFDIKRIFDHAVDLGCGRGYVSRNISSDSVKKLTMCDLSSTMLEQAFIPEDTNVQVEKLVVDEENLPFEPESIDLIVSNLSLHWVNNLPSTFDQIMKCLKNDGVFLACVFGGDTLFELRCSLQLAGLEREGGVSAHISPFTQVRDIGSLLTRSGFTMQTVDTDEIRVGYPSMFELMYDLKGMGENNAAWNRRVHLHRETLLAASAIYSELYGDEKGVPATFQIIYLLGWKPDPSQPKPVKRGSGNVSLKDIYRLDEIVKETKTMPINDVDNK